MEKEEAFLSHKQLSLLEYVFMRPTPLQGIYTCSRCDHAAPLPPVKDGKQSAPEGDEGEEEVSSAYSPGFVVATLWSSAVN